MGIAGVSLATHGATVNRINVLKIPAPSRATLLAFLLFLAVSPAYWLCKARHYCMAGHLKHPDDFTPLARLSDGIWVIGFLASVLLAFRSDIPFRYAFVFFLGVGFLGVLDPNSLGEILRLPVHVALALFAIACLAGWVS